MNTERMKINGRVIGQGINLKTKLKRNLKGSPYFLVIYKGKATAAYFSYAIQALITEAGIEEGDSLKYLSEVITLTLDIDENGELNAQLHP